MTAEDKLVDAVTNKLLGITFYWWRCNWCQHEWKATQAVPCSKCHSRNVKRLGEE